MSLVTMVYMVCWQTQKYYRDESYMKHPLQKKHLPLSQTELICVQGYMWFCAGRVILCTYIDQTANDCHYLRMCLSVTSPGCQLSISGRQTSIGFRSTWGYLLQTLTGLLASSLKLLRQMSPSYLKESNCLKKWYNQDPVWSHLPFYLIPSNISRKIKYLTRFLTSITNSCLNDTMNPLLQCTWCIMINLN